MRPSNSLGFAIASATAGVELVAHLGHDVEQVLGVLARPRPEHQGQVVARALAFRTQRGVRRSTSADGTSRARTATRPTVCPTRSRRRTWPSSWISTALRRASVQPSLSVGRTMRALRNPVANGMPTSSLCSRLGGVLEAETIGDLVERSLPVRTIEDARARDDASHPSRREGQARQQRQRAERPDDHDDERRRRAYGVRSAGSGALRRRDVRWRS